MEIKDLTQTKQEIEPLFILMEDLEISTHANIYDPIECILLDRNQEYYYNSEKHILDVMYFKFNDSSDNCIILGKFNNGKIN